MPATSSLLPSFSVASRRRAVMPLHPPRAASEPASAPSDGVLTLGLDFGTSGVRAAVVDAAGCELAGGRHVWPEGASADWPAAWVDGLSACVLQLPAHVRARVGALAADGTSATALLVDSSGQPLVAPLLYNHVVPGAGALLRQLGVPGGHTCLAGGSTQAKLRWWRAQGKLPPGCVLEHQADFVAAWLTGVRGVSDWNNALKLGFDPGAADRWPAWLAQGDAQLAAALPRDVLPPGAPLGRRASSSAAALQLPPHCVVAAGTTDSIAAFLAAAGSSPQPLQPGDAVTSLGSTLAVKLLSTSRVDSADFGIYSHRLPGGEWLVGGASNTGGAVLRSVWGGADSDAQLASLSSRIDPSVASPLHLYPLVTAGERFPVCDPGLQPVMGPRPDDDALYLHALLEGMARIEADGYHQLARLGATSLRRVLTAGGGARNAQWTAIRERVLGVPVDASAQGEAAYGAALLARRALASP